MSLRKLMILTSLAISLSTTIFLCLSDSAMAQSLSLDLGQGGSTTSTVVQLIALITVLSLAPSLLIMVTSFTRIVIVLSFLRTALGTQQTPPNQVLISLALFITIFIMMPVFQESYDKGIQPLINEEIDEFEAFNRSVEPVQKFMMTHVRERDLALFADIAKVPDQEIRDNFPLNTSFHVKRIKACV